MRNMQEVILEQIKKAMADDDLELVVNYRYTNTGTGYIMDGIRTVVYFNFSFQTQYCTIDIKNAGDIKLHTRSYLEYKKVNEIEDLLDWFREMAENYGITKTIEAAEADNGKAI